MLNNVASVFVDISHTSSGEFACTVQYTDSNTYIFDLTYISPGLGNIFFNVTPAGTTAPVGAILRCILGPGGGSEVSGYYGLGLEYILNQGLVPQVPIQTCFHVLLF